MSSEEGLPSPYGALEKMVAEYRENGERVPFSASNTSAPQMYSKGHSPELELIPTLLVKQTDHYVPEIFYDPVSEEVVSIGRDASTVELSEVMDGETEREVNVDSLLWASAQRGLLGDTDTHRRQYAVGADGEVYTFDFGAAGHGIPQAFKRKDFGRDIVDITAQFIRRLGLEDRLLDGQLNSYIRREKLQDRVEKELEERMRTLASQIDIEQFEQEIEQHPNIESRRRSPGTPLGYGADQMIENVQNLRDPGFDPSRRPTKEEKETGIL